MGKKDFINDLRDALKENGMDESVINNNVVYYEKYIDQKVSEGMNESDVISELGNGRIIAKTIVDAEKKGFKSSYYNTASDGFAKSNNDYEKNKKESSFKFDTSSHDTQQSHTGEFNNNQSLFGFLMQNTTTKTKIKAIAICCLVIAAIILFLIFTFKMITFLLPFVLLMIVVGIIFKFIMSR